MAERITFIPTDPLFGLQWHLNNTGQIIGAVSGQDINVVQVWPDYTGQGIVVAVFDDGFDQTHPDLIENYRVDLSRDLILDISGALSVALDDDHGTAVAGLIGASANNGIGGVGVAWNASLIGYRGIDEPQAELFSSATLLMLDEGADISSNSWGPGTEAFGASTDQPLYIESVLRLATSGREGLGTIVLFSGGNDREKGYDTNQDVTTNIPYTINVAAGMANGLITSYSTPGATILVTAPGSDPASIVTTDRQGSSGYNPLTGEAGNYTNVNGSFFNGTSASAPIAAGVIALILEANPQLGYRDVQEILVYSSKRAVFLDVEDIPSDFNQAVDWNGGGLLTGYDFGFGNIDTHAAVRLAETWQKTSTTNNLEIIEGDVLTQRLAITAGSQAQAVAVFAQDNRVEQVTVTIDLQTERLQDVILELVSPGGTRSILINRPPVEDDDDGDPVELTTHLRSYTLNTVRAWGESLQGDWTLRITNAATGAPITLNDWSITAHAADHTTPRTQIFTDEFVTFASLDSSRLTISANNGADINASAVTEDSVLDLSGGTSTIGGVEITLIELDRFYNLFAGDGDDDLIGNALDNNLYGGSGSDFIVGGLGNDDIDGGEGIDQAAYAASISTTIATARDANGLVTIRTSFGTDTLSNIESVSFSDETVSINALLGRYAPPVYQTNAGQITANIYAGPVDFLHFQMLGTTSGDIVNGSSGNDFMNLLGGDDAASGGAGQDVLDGGVGSNFLTGGADADTFFIDNRSGSNTWSTISDFSTEDSVNIWGWQQGTSQLILSFDHQGAEGFKGATFHYDLNGNGLIDTSITFSSLTLASMSSPMPIEVAGNGCLLFA